MNPITEKELADIVTAIRTGSDLETACHFAGASTAHVYKTVELGKIMENTKTKNPDEIFAIKLWLELKQARAQAIVRSVAYVQKAAQDGDWRAAAWWLERAVPTSYSKQSNNMLNSSEQVKEIE
jgi:hypothetical protein